MAILGTQKTSYKWLFAELTVVVIGILIAFQVEEWRTTRNDRLLVLASMEALLLELDDELSEIDIFIPTARRQVGAVIEIMERILSEDDVNEAWLRDNYFDVVRSRSWQPHDSTYTSLRDSGSFFLIPSQELKDELFDYYEFEEFMLERLESTANARRRYIDILALDLYFVPRSFGLPENRSEELQFVKPIVDFPRHPEFLNALGNYGGNLRAAVPRLEDLRARNIKLQELVQTELDPN